jgi:hypothetical protein
LASAKARISPENKRADQRALNDRIIVPLLSVLSVGIDLTRFGTRIALRRLER